MAFVRYKMVRGKKYYQYVRNYREDGRHKQEVLCHLGPHDSLDGAINYENQMILKCLEIASELEREANDAKSYMLDFYGDEIGNRVPTSWAAQSRYEAFLYEREEHLFEEHNGSYYQPKHFTTEEWHKEWQRWDTRWRIENDLLESIIQHHDARWDAERYRAYAAEHRKKRDKYIEVRRKHP